jgi:hypothetical protein
LKKDKGTLANKSKLEAEVVAKMFSIVMVKNIKSGENN